MSKEVMKLALEALEAIGSQYVCRSTHHIKAQQHHGYEACPNELTHEAAITALREALAEQPAQQEPVARAKAITECLAVLRPAVRGKFPQEQALEELAGYTRPQAREPEQPAQQEPVVRWDSDGWGDLLVDGLPDGTLLYTSPPAQRTWVGLTDDEHEEAVNVCLHVGVEGLVFWLEDKLKEKNT